MAIEGTMVSSKAAYPIQLLLCFVNFLLHAFPQGLTADLFCIEPSDSYHKIRPCCKQIPCDDLRPQQTERLPIDDLLSKKVPGPGQSGDVPTAL
jgi:hypothetical protein